MIAKILISPNLEQRREAILKILEENNLGKENPDVFYLPDEEKLGVSVTKKIREFLGFRPNKAKGKGVAIESAQNLTPDAQNSLLKTLEEPPEEAVLILGVEKESQLLPTVLSRCEVINLESKLHNSELVKYSEEIEKLRSATIEERFEYIEKLEDKEGFLKALVSYYRSQLPENLEFSKKLLEAERWEGANVNIRAILEYLMLEM